jgi:hypothetical protein
VRILLLGAGLSIVVCTRNSEPSRAIQSPIIRAMWYTAYVQFMTEGKFCVVGHAVIVADRVHNANVEAAAGHVVPEVTISSRTGILLCGWCLIGRIEKLKQYESKLLPQIKSTMRCNTCYSL